MKIKYKDWTMIDWDGNPELGLKCWRKSFGRGHVSIGVGDFLLVCYSYGANSDQSLSSTRWRQYGAVSEDAMKDYVDRMGGKYRNHKYAFQSP